MYTALSIFAKPIAWLLFWLYGIVGSYGIAILILTLIVRTILFPLYNSQMKQSASMSDLQPKLQKLQKQYGNDKEKYNQKVMELYQDEGVNPAKGCLPLLVQMPILFGLFAALRNPIQYMDNPDAILAIHESFLWVQDLSQPDKWILPILAGITTYFSYKITSSASPQTASTMKVFQYIFPLMIVWWGRSFPAGLTIYWFVGTLYMCVQQKVVLTRLKKIKARKEEERLQQEAYEREHPELFVNDEPEEEKEEKPVVSNVKNKAQIIDADDEEIYGEYESVDDYSDFYTEEELAKMKKNDNKNNKNNKNQKKKK